MGEGLSPMGGGAISEGRGVISDGDDEQLLLLLRGAGGECYMGSILGTGEDNGRTWVGRYRLRCEMSRAMPGSIGGGGWDR